MRMRTSFFPQSLSNRLDKDMPIVANRMAGGLDSDSPYVSKVISDQGAVIGLAMVWKSS